MLLSLTPPARLPIVQPCMQVSDADAVLGHVDFHATILTETVHTARQCLEEKSWELLRTSLFYESSEAANSVSEYLLADIIQQVVPQYGTAFKTSKSLLFAPPAR